MDKVTKIALPYPVEVLFCPSEKSWSRFARKLGLRKEDFIPEEGYSAFTCAFTAGDSYIFVRVHPSLPYAPLSHVFGLFAHEASHVFDYLCEFIGEDKPSPEFKAYTTEYVCREMLRAYDKYIHNGKPEWDAPVQELEEIDVNFDME